MSWSWAAPVWDGKESEDGALLPLSPWVSAKITESERFVLEGTLKITWLHPHALDRDTKGSVCPQPEG